MADLPRQLSVGDLVVSCPGVRTELNENEAELSVIGGDAVQSKSVGDFDSQLSSQHEAVINISARLEAESPRVKIKAACQCNPAVIDGELTASEASNKSDETARQMTRV